MKRNIRNARASVLLIALLPALPAFSGESTGPAPAPGMTTLQIGTRAGSPVVRRVVGPNAPAQAGFDRFIVQYRSGTATRASQATLVKAVNAAALRAGVADARLSVDGARGGLAVHHVRSLAGGGDVIRLSRRLDRVEANALLAQLRSDPGVLFAQPDYLKQHFAFAPNDPRYADLQWHYSHPTAGIKAPAAWDVSAGAGVVVAMLDTGYVEHADLRANLVPGYDFVASELANDGDGRDADAHDPGDWVEPGTSSFHGTHVAGTIAAVTHNKLALAGVAFKAKVQPVRVLGQGGGYSSDIADAITWASGGTVAGVPKNANPAEVINLSLGSYGACDQDPVTQAAIDGAMSRGTTVVVAAGNYSIDAGSYSPASCKGVITVGATNKGGARASYSNFGATVTLSAPGGEDTGVAPDYGLVWSLGNSGTTKPDASPAGDRMVGMEGTSMASPHVAGVVALMQSAAIAAGKPPLTPAQVKSVLRTTASPFTVPPPVSRSQGPGIVNAAAAVLAATKDIPVDNGILLDNRIALAGQGGGAGDTLLYRIVVPAGKASLNLRTFGGAGDVSLYVARGRTPSATNFDRKSARPGNAETVLVTRPAAGTYYVAVVGEVAFSNVSVMAVH
jgi:serine protease